MKKLVALLLTGAMCLSLVACGDSAQTSNTSTSTDTAATTDSTSTDAADTTAASTDDSAAADTAAAGASSISVCLASEPATIDPALNSAVDGASLLVHLFSGLAKWEDNDGVLSLVADAATELPEGVENEDGTVTYTYTLRDGLKWSDGQDVTANDFVFAWNRAASDDLAADYGYMFEVVDGYDEVAEGSADSMNIKAVDDKTIEVHLRMQFLTGTSFLHSLHTSPYVRML